MNVQRRIFALAPWILLAATVLFTRSEARVVNGLDRQEAGQEIEVSIRNGAYEPAQITVTGGTTVVWKNEDRMPHTVNASDGGWGSDTIEPGGTYSHRFDGVGSFSYYCVPHPDMTGMVIVR